MEDGAGYSPEIVSPNSEQATNFNGTSSSGPEASVRHYNLYAHPMTEELKKTFQETRSTSLKENPKARLDPFKEAQDYFAKQKPGYIEKIQELNDQIAEPPAPNLRAIVWIPVAGHQEGKNIYNTLENYTHQDLSQDQYELLLFVNHPEVDKQGKRVQPDETLSEIERFKSKYPDLPVRVIQKTLPLEEANIGTVRKYLTDTALYRHHQRG